MESPSPYRVEISASYRFVQEHQWVIHGITGFFSAYYMEKPGFQVFRHFEELETGMHVWVCDIPPDMRVQRLLKRLQVDLPPFIVTERPTTEAIPIIRYVIDCKEDDS